MQENMNEPQRIRKVRQSMKAIKVVLGERYRAFKTASTNTTQTLSLFLSLPSLSRIVCLVL